MPNPARNVLIVDDEAVTRQALAEILQQMGHSVRCAANGLCALELMRERLPDVLLSDLQMLEMSGFELLSVVRRRLPDIYVIAMSGAFSGDHVPTGIAADAFYQKATSLESLLKLMEVGLNPARKHPYRSTAQTPMWVPKNRVQGSGESYVLIGCPECMRSFQKSVQEATGLVHETRCIYCSTSIHYAIVHSNGPFPAQGVVGRPALRTVSARSAQRATGS
jgi:CheY-like chemotaxis protein